MAYTWNGTANSNATTGWSASGAWNGGSNVPGSGDTITFDGTSPSSTVTLGGSQAINGITIATGATGSTTISSGGTAGFTLTLGTGGITDGPSTGTVVIGSPTANSNFTINLAGSQVWANNNAASSGGGNPMFIYAAVNGAAGASTTQTLTINGTGGTQFLTSICDGSGGGNLALNWSGNGNLTLQEAGTYSGGTTLTSGTGTLFVASTTAFGSGTITINGGNIVNNTLNSIALSNNNAININGNFAFGGAHSLNMGTGAVTLGGTNTTYTISTGTSSGLFFDLNGTVTGGSGDNITQTGNSTLALGGVALSSGTLTTGGGGGVQLGNGTSGGISGVNGIILGGSSTITFELANGTNYTGTVSAGAGTFVHGNESSGVTNTLSGVISGGGNLAQVGSGTTILAATETYTGNTTATNGTLQIGNGATGSISSSSTGSITSGATIALDLADGSTFSNVITDNGTLNAMQAGTTTITSTITGSGVLTATGTGTTVLTAASTYTGNTTVANGATLQLQNALAIQDSGTLNLASGSTLQLRANTASKNTTTTFSATPMNLTGSGSNTVNFDVGNLSSGTGNTLALTGTLALPLNTNDQINVTGSGSSTLVLGGITASGNSNTTTDTLNATTAALDVGFFQASPFSTNLVLEGGNNITFGTSATPSGTTTLTSNSNGGLAVNVNGANATIWGTFATTGLSGTRSVTLTSGELNLNSVNALTGGVSLNLNGGTLDSTGSGAIAIAATNGVNIGGSFAYGGTNNLSIAGGAALSNNSTITANVAGKTLTFGTLSMSGNKLALAGPGNVTFGTTTVSGTGNTISNGGTGTFSFGSINNSQAGSVDITTGGILSSGTNGSANGLIMSVLDTVNNGADFAAIGSGGAVVARNSIVAETALPGGGTGSTGSTTVFFLTGSLALTASDTTGALRINDTSTTDSLTLGANNLVLGGAGASGLLYNGGANGQYLITGTGFVTGGTGHSMNINTYAGTLTINAPILDGTGNSFDVLNKAGSGTLVLSGTNAYGGTSGGTNVGGGALDLGNGNTGAFTGAATINVFAGASLGIGLTNGSTVVASIVDSGTVIGIESAGVTNTYTTGSITGSGGFVQNGAGTTVLSGSNFYTGSTTINAGAIKVTNQSGLGTASHPTAGVLVNSGGALQLANNITTTGSYTLTLNGAGVTGAANGALENISGANTYTSSVTLASAASIGVHSGTLTLSNVVKGGNTLTLLGAGNLVFSNTISGLTGITDNSTGGVTFSGNLSGLSGTIAINSGPASFSGSVGGSTGLTINTTSTVTLTGTNANTYTGQTVVTSGELDLDKTSSTTAAIVGAGGLNVLSPDILVNGGTLKFLANDQLGNSNDSTGNVTLLLSSGTVSLNGTTQTLYAFENNGGTFTTGTGSMLGTGATTTFAGGTNTVDAGGTIEDSHFVISGGTNVVQGGSTSGVILLDAGGAGMQFSNGANLTLNSDNTNAGEIQISQFGSGFTISSSAASTTASITSASGGLKAGSILLDGQNVNFSVAAGSVAGGGADMSVSANIVNGSSSGASVTKSGLGILSLSGSNTYSGGTSVNAGTLIMANSGTSSAAGTGSLTVSNNATIGGTGRYSGAGFSVSGTGTATGSRANVLVGMTSTIDTNTSSVLTMLGTATSTITNANLTFNINAATAGALGSNPAGSGTELSIGSSKLGFGTGVGAVQLTLNVQNEPAIIAGFTPYVLIAGTVASGGTGVNGSQYTGLTLAGTALINSGGVTETIITGSNLQLAFGSSVDQGFYGANSYLVLYQNTGTNVDDIEVIVVPEPGTWALMLGGLGLLLFWQRRKGSYR